MNTFQFTHHNETFEGQLDTFHKYNDNGNTVVRLVARPVGGSDDDWELYATLSVNTDLVLPPDEFVFKMYSENHGLYHQVWRAGLISPTSKFQTCGFAGPQPVVKLIPNAVTSI